MGESERSRVPGKNLYETVLRIELTRQGIPRSVFAELDDSFGSIFDWGIIDESNILRGDYPPTLSMTTLLNSWMLEILQAAWALKATHPEIPIDPEAWMSRDHCQIYCGLWPDNTVNARCQKIGDVALVLVNTGLLRLLHRVSRIVCGTLGFIDESHEYHPPSLSDQDARDYYRKAFTDSLERGSISEPAFELALENERSALRYYSWGLRFVLAHELAHILLGHLTFQFAHEFAPGYEAPADLASRLDEHNADVYSSILQHICFEQPDDRSFFGQIFFFEISDALWMQSRGLGLIALNDDRRVAQLLERRRESHPHPAMRRAQCIEATARIAGIDEFPHSDGLIETFSFLSGYQEINRDPVSVATIVKHAGEGDAETFLRIFVPETFPNGLRRLSRKFWNEFSTSFEEARGLLSLAAVSYLSHEQTHRMAISEQSQYVLTNAYSAFQRGQMIEADEDRYRRAAEFMVTVRSAIPELERVLLFGLQVSASYPDAPQE
ncbi:hypothetical protein KTR9_4890 (plasmid) [Gordonia sp. KTR9]|nr:hypothetical protein KTR9_4890 [Gordonia sp. KTR9]